jgi:hypothetical protein
LSDYTAHSKVVSFLQPPTPISAAFTKATAKQRARCWKMSGGASLQVNCLHGGHGPRAVGLVVAPALDAKPAAVAPVAAQRKGERYRGGWGGREREGEGGGGEEGAWALTCPNCCGRASTCSKCYKSAVRDTRGRHYLVPSRTPQPASEMMWFTPCGMCHSRNCDAAATEKQRQK